jgi:hypothetical protein
MGPDTCTCTDGYEGDDCNTPLCRHLQVTGAVSSCLNGGICSLKDRCDCVQTESVLWQVSIRYCYAGLARLCPEGCYLLRHSRCERSLLLLPCCDDARRLLLSSCCDELSLRTTPKSHTTVSYD